MADIRDLLPDDSSAGLSSGRECKGTDPKGWSYVVEVVRGWREARCAESCPRCPINCCEGRLNPRLDSLEAFAGLPRVRGPLDPRPIDGPYVLDRRVLKRWGSCYLVGRCPHLDSGKRCDIFGTADRPQECAAYPLHVQKVAGGRVLSAELSCWIFQQQENRANVEVLARELDLEVVFHPARDVENR